MAQPREVAIRYAPFFGVAAILLLLVAVVPSVGPETGDGAYGSGGPIVAGGPTAGGPTAGPGAVDGGEGLVSQPGGAAAPGGASRPGGPAAGSTTPGGVASADGTGIGGLGANGVGYGIDPRDPGEWPWTHPWKLTGDRSKCAPGGKVQDNVLSVSGPCMPKFTGDNGGATYQGVTKDEIVGVYYLPKVDPAGNAILSQADLDASKEEYDAALQTFAEFFNKHYEFYGRKMKMILYQGECDGVDITCMRNEARKLNAKHKPFWAVYTSAWPAEFWDELSRLGVVNFGCWMCTDRFMEAHRPFHWDLFMSGNQAARNSANYYCQKMAGKPASLAGDPLLRTQERKLGIVVIAEDSYAQAGDEMAAQVSGGECGGPEDKPPIFTYSTTVNDQARAQEQFASIAVGLKEAGVTTVACVCDLFAPIFFTRALDNQQYFPEHLLSGMEGVDYEVVARLYSPTQWQNAFGPGPRPHDAEREKQDHHLAWHSLGKEGEPRFVTLVTMLYMRAAAMLLQWSGPNLTPLTFERGAIESPQIGGYENPSPWDGWTCCSPHVQLVQFGPGDYNGNEDSREVYYDPNAISGQDGKPGAMICVQGCKRYRIGAWPKGEPKQ